MLINLSVCPPVNWRSSSFVYNLILCLAWFSITVKIMLRAIMFVVHIHDILHYNATLYKWVILRSRPSEGCTEIVRQIYASKHFNQLSSVDGETPFYKAEVCVFISFHLNAIHSIYVASDLITIFPKLNISHIYLSYQQLSHLDQKNGHYAMLYQPNTTNTKTSPHY